MQRIHRDTLYYVFSKDIEPVARLHPAETVVVETEDAYSGRIRQSEDFTRQDFLYPRYGNPVTGPFYIEGAQPGDILEVSIEHIACDSQGLVLHRPGHGGLPDMFSMPDTRLVTIEEDHVRFNERIKIPVQPLIGTIGTAPALEALLSTVPGPHGGNMDCPFVKPGCKLFLPVKVEGALLALGDVHAAQGDGEFCGVGVEIRSEVTLTPYVHKQRWEKMKWPRIELDDSIVSVAADKPLESALRLAFIDMIAWLEEDFGVDPSEAYLLLSQVGDARICQIVNPLYTVGCVMPKDYI